VGRARCAALTVLVLQERPLARCPAMATSPQREQCKQYLREGPYLNVAEFVAWFGAHNDGEWVNGKSENGWTPLHYAMANNAPAEAIKLLVEACPEGVKEKDRVGNTPLHFGMQRLLVEACPEGGKEKDGDGMTPLHLGMTKKAPTEVIKLLVEALPRGWQGEGREWQDSVTPRDDAQRTNGGDQAVGRSMSRECQGEGQEWQDSVTPRDDAQRTS
jgi:hypothetical protein